jgi:CRP-like cAMP-binding protein
MSDVPREALAGVHLFTELSPDALAKLAALMEARTVAAGGTIFLAREPGDALYVIVRGRVRIWLQDEDAHSVTLSELGAGDFFGELAVIDGEPRSANASAIEDCTLGCLARHVCEAFLLEHPRVALDVIRGLGARLRQTDSLVAGRAARNANVVHQEHLSALDRVAIAITDKVGSFGFFLTIAAWTLLWTGYNLLASLVPALHWRAFDPFPAFVAYLLISNVIQIMLMPLIMVGQNIQGRHAETRAQLDFEINQKAEREVTTTLVLLERQTALMHRLMRHLDCPVAD